MNYAPIARIALRYVAGGMLMGSTQIGTQLAADPDIVAALAIAIGFGVEAVYAFAKKNGLGT